MEQTIQAAPQRRLACLSGVALKYIAMASMVIDHFNSFIMRALRQPYMEGNGIVFSPEQPFLVRNAPQVGAICDVLGSIAIPIFCFLIAEGFVHTRNRRKYGLLLLAFAVLSEFPYDLAHYGYLFEFRLQNVIFTLATGFFTLWALEWVSKKCAGHNAKLIACSALAVLAGAGIAFLARGEYVFLGVASIALFYLLRNRGAWRLLGAAPLMVASPWVLLALIPLVLYNGTRGNGSKYFFYAFYPAHFLVLYLIAQAL